MKPSKWVEDDGMYVRDFGPFKMLAWEDEQGAEWSIEGDPGYVTREAKSLAGAKRSADRAARKMVRKMAAELGMVKL